MKQRLLTAAVGVTVAIAWLFTMYTPVFSVVMALIAVIAEYEMLKVFEVKNIPFKAVCYVLSAGTVLYTDYSDKIRLPMFPVVTAVVLLSLIIMVLDFERLRFEQVVCSLFSAALIPAALSSVILFRDVYIKFPDVFRTYDGIFFILLAFFCSGLRTALHSLQEKLSENTSLRNI